MVRYINKAIYFTEETGGEISKRIAKRDYYITKTIKYIKKNDESRERGYEYITITTEYWKQCRRKSQLRLF